MITQEDNSTYLLQLVHQICRVVQDVAIGAVEIFCQNLVDHPVFTCVGSVHMIILA